MSRDQGVRRLEVLLVEDNPGDVHLIREAFEESGIDSSLTVVTDGEAALDYLHQRNGYESETKPDLTLLDLNVPKVNGRNVLEEIKDDPDLRSVPVIVLTSSASRDDIHETYALGANGYFVKKVDPNGFISLIQKVEESLADSGRLPLGKYSEIDRER